MRKTGILTFAAAAALPLMASVSMQARTASPGPTSGQEEMPGQRYAVTDFSVNYLREKPDFTAELGNQLLMGTPVEITGREGYWIQVLSPDPYRAWCVDMGLTEMSEEEILAYVAAPKYICTAMYSRLMEAPDSNADQISDLVAGDLVLAAGQEKKHIRKGYIRVMTPSGIEGYAEAADIEKFDIWAGNADASAGNIISTARKFLGVPYLWGGTTVKGVDCSGFTRMVWFLNGVLLPRNATEQAKAGLEVKVDFSTDPASLDGTLPEDEMKEEMLRRIRNLQPGDLIFFGTPAPSPGITHTGIYLGDGRFIHASKKVRYSSLIPGDKDFYELSHKMICARRIIGQEDSGTDVTSMLKSPAYFPQRQ